MLMPVFSFEGNLSSPTRGASLLLADSPHGTQGVRIASSSPV
jgi:hypothetical protein